MGKLSSFQENLLFQHQNIISLPAVLSYFCAENAYGTTAEKLLKQLHFS